MHCSIIKMLVRRPVKEVDILLNHFGKTSYLYYGKMLKNLKKYLLNLKNKKYKKINFGASDIANIYLIGNLEGQKGNTTGKYNVI